MIRRQFVCTVVAAVIAMISLAAFNSQASFAKDSVPRIEGTLVSVNVPASTVTVRNRSGDTTLTIPGTAKVERNSVRVGLAAFKVGDRVQARFAADGSVIKFEGVGR